MSQWEIVGICASMLTAAAAVTMGLLTFVKRRAADGRAASQSQREASTGADEIGAEVRELMEQLDRLAGRLDAKIDARLDELRKALAEADAKIAEIRELAAQDSAPAHSKRTIKIGQALGDEVARLSRSGMDAVEVARQLKIDVGEVELFLSLDRSQRLKQA